MVTSLAFAGHRWPVPVAEFGKTVRHISEDVYEGVLIIVAVI